jgi:ComF family protein
VTTLATGGRRFIATLLDLVFPRDCCGCDTPLSPSTPGAFCAGCLARIRPIAHPMCPVCGIPRPPGILPCPRCVAAPPAFTRARAVAYYSTPGEDQNPLARAIWRLKYERRADIAPRLGAFFRAALPYASRECDLVIPVPLHRDRLRWRGFNQACLLAIPVAHRLGLPLSTRALVRRRETAPQVSLPDGARHRNVRGAFVAPAPARVAGRRILVVDDVYTTGATVTECARALRRAGARSVEVLTLCRAGAR